MISNVIRLMAVSFLLVSSTMFGVEVDSKKALVIEGIIAQGNILPLGKKLLDMANAGESEAHLIISSPGGEIITGFLFLNLMEAAKAKGLKIVCFVPTVAASMAYQIFLHCDERHVLNNAYLLWHRARINVGGLGSKPMTGPEMMQLGKDLELTDNAIFNEVVKYMGGHEMGADDLLYHFNAETLHIGANLHVMLPSFVTSHKAIDGLFDSFMDRKVPRNSPLDRGAMRLYQIIYISDMVD